MSPAAPAVALPAAAPALGLALGVVADRLLGDPRTAHPVAAFGRAAAALERVAHRDSRAVGVLYAGALVAAAAATGSAAERVARGSTARTVLVHALAGWAVLGGTTLLHEAATMDALLRASEVDGDLDAARARLSHLCGRDATRLDRDGLARATVESVAENTADAVVGPLVWGTAFGVPGLLAYRAANTLDAMVGHRSPRHLHFGWAAARLDDLANLVPARLTASLAVALAPLVGGRRRAARRVWRRDGHKHPSPNAGPVEAAFAGALGRTLGGRVAYAGRVEERPLLGDGPAPDLDDVARAVRLSRAVQAAAAGLAVFVLLARPDPARPVAPRAVGDRPPAGAEPVDARLA